MTAATGIILDALATTIALTKDEAEAIARANAALSWIRADTFPWAYARGGEIKAVRDTLVESLGDYAALTTREAHPASVFPDLGFGHAAVETALGRVTADIAKWTDVLVGMANQAEEAARRQEEGLAS